MNRFFEFSQAQMKSLTLLAVVVLLTGGYKVIRTYAVPEEDHPHPWTETGLGRYQSTLTLDVNLSPAESLELAPYIGPTLARRIVDYRQQQGGFLSFDSLIHVKGIGPKTLEKIRPYFRVDAP